MKPIALAIVCGIGVTLMSFPAMAGEQVVAKLQTPVRGPARIIAGDAVFFCADDTCQAPAPTSQTFTISTCKAIATRFGPVAAFTGRSAYEPDQLARCNAGVAPRVTTAQGVILP